MAMCTISEGDYKALCKEAGIEPRSQKKPAPAAAPILTSTTGSPVGQQVLQQQPPAPLNIAATPSGQQQPPINTFSRSGSIAQQQQVPQSTTNLQQSYQQQAPPMSARGPQPSPSYQTR
jgi:hypothetical protein